MMSDVIWLAISGGVGWALRHWGILGGSTPPAKKSDSPLLDLLHKVAEQKLKPAAKEEEKVKDQDLLQLLRELFFSKS